MSAVPAAVECVRYVVDVNPFLHGRFMMGTGLEIKAPQFLGEYRPDLVIIMNPIYRSEIVSALESMLVRAEVLVLGLNLETS
jgi:hypothetical protein